MFGIRQRALHHYGRIKELPGNTLFAKETSKGISIQIKLVVPKVIKISFS